MTALSTKPPDPWGDSDRDMDPDPLPAARLEWDDDTTTIDLWTECRDRGLSLSALDPR